jgi:aspartate/methionine/tyrosine aminotransferase
LKTAEQHDFMIVEDDIYCDMHPGAAVQSATRISALDQLNRVIYLGGFPKHWPQIYGSALSPPRRKSRCGYPIARCYQH